MTLLARVGPSSRTVHTRVHWVKLLILLIKRNECAFFDKCVQTSLEACAKARFNGSVASR